MNENLQPRIFARLQMRRNKGALIPLLIGSLILIDANPNYLVVIKVNIVSLAYLNKAAISDLIRKGFGVRILLFIYHITQCLEFGKES